MNRIKALAGEFFDQTKSELNGIKNEPCQLKLLHQDMKNNIKKNTHYYFFLLLMFLGLIQLYVCINVTNGDCIKEFLFENPVEPFADMFMDYFNPIRSLYMENPYTKINAIYPPINYLLLSVFYKFIPANNIIPDLKGDYFELLSMRNNREAMFSYFAYCFLAILILITIINKFLKKHDIKMLFLFDVAVLFSWGFLFTFDRGNFLLFPVAFILLFFYSNESESRVKQELGLAALALAVCMKIYPVFLSLYLLTQKKYSQFIRFAIYCILIFFFPFVFFGGTESVIAIIKNIFVESGKIGELYPGGNISFQNSIYLLELLSGNSNWLTAFLKSYGPVIIVILGSISVFFMKEKWKITALLTCIFLQFFPNSMVYNLLYMIVPLIIFLTEKNKSGFDYVYVILFFFCMVPFPYVAYDVYAELQAGDGCNITYGLLFTSSSLFLMTLLFIGRGLIEGMKAIQRKKNHSEQKKNMAGKSYIMKKKKKKYQMKNLSKCYAILIILLIFIYHMFFVRSTIPAQAGWWHYLGWRLTEGDILYKDIYCHVQPFFPWFVAALYKIFHSNFILYIIPGLLMRISETLMVYKILLKIVKPAIAAFASFIAVIFTTSTVYDIVFDYNTTVLFLVILIAYLFVKYLESYDIKKKRNFYCIFTGVIAGILFLMKQTDGTIVPFSVFVLLIIVTLKKEGKTKIIENISRFILGALIILLPALIYILMTNSFSDYIHCIIFGMSSKGSTLNKVSNIFNNMINGYDILITITVLFLMFLFKYKSYVVTKLYYMLNSYFLLVIAFCIWERFGYALRGLPEVFKIAPEFFAVSLFLTLIWIIFRMSKKRKYNIYVSGGIVCCVFALILFYWYGKRKVFHGTVYLATDFQTVRTYIVYIVHYFFAFFWIRDTWRVIIQKECPGEIYAFNTVITALNISRLLSGTPDELLVLPSAAYVLAQLFYRRVAFNSAKNTLLVYSSIAFVLICFSQKMFRPYQWHGWTEAAIERDHLVSSSIEGLEGYLLPDSTEEKYELIVNTILENSSDEDYVYQFPTITLFNVLTHRRAPTYMPVHYFDVCSDETATADAEYLTNHPPKIVLWDELGEESWTMHEQLFRGGERSGQRDIQNFYYTTVHEEYYLAASVENNMGGNIEVWVLKE